MTRIDSRALQGFYHSVFRALGAPGDLAHYPARVLIEADLVGNPTHGIRRLPVYVRRIQDGGTDPAARPAVEVSDHGRVDVDGRNGLGQVVATVLAERVVEQAAHRGYAIGFARNSNHVGALGFYAQVAADHGQVGFFISGVAPTLAPTGGTRAVLGSNPWAVAMPFADFPIVMDVANGVTISDRLRSAAAAGEQLPPGQALGPDGHPTTDPASGLAGSILPIGGHKGYLLTLFFEVLASVLSGASFSSRIPSFTRPEKPKSLGHFMLAIRPDGVDFPERMAELAGNVQDQPAADPLRPPRLPGARANAVRCEYLERGIRLDPDSLALIARLAGELNVQSPL